MHRFITSRTAAIVSVLALLALIATGVGAQDLPGMEAPSPAEPVEEDELEDFASAYIEVQGIQSRLDEQMSTRLDSSEIGAERFYTLNQMAQESGSTEEGLAGVDEDELAEYREVLDDLLALQDQMQGEMTEALEEEGLSVTRFNEIIAAVQQDPDLAEKAQTYIEEELAEQEG